MSSARQATASYIPLQDDEGPKTLSNVEREFVRSCAFRPHRAIRTDGRDWKQMRPQRLQLVRWEEGATATVQWGSGTRVTCSCMAELIAPNADRPSEGIVNLSVDLSPSASTAFRQANPVGTSSSQGSALPPPDPDQKLLTNRILRSLERILLMGGALDTEALCVTPGHWVWRMHLAITVVDYGGNLLDACTLACMAALRHYRKPQLDMITTDGSSSAAPPRIISPDLKEPIPLPLHHTPLSVSFALIPQEDVLKGTMNSKMTEVSTLVDPNDREELVMTGALTIAMNIHKEICLLDYGGGCELQPSELKECHSIAESCIQQLCESLEKSLKEADEQAQAETLHRLQQKQHPGFDLPPLPEADIEGIPYFQTNDAKDDYMQVDTGSTADTAVAAQAESKAEEEYRKQALDYNLGHVAMSIQEDDDTKRPKPLTSTSLLKAMLDSAKSPNSDSNAPAGADVSPKEVDEAPQDVTRPPKPAKKSEVAEDIASTNEASSSAATLTSQTTRENAAMPLDSDEEDTTMQLQSEFAPADKAIKEDDEVEDLSAAIKTKKKKSKKSKKGKS